MNRINSSKFYPNDWEEKKLGELGVFLKGKGISKSDIKETGYPCILYGEIYTRHHNYIKQFYSYVDEETANKSIVIKKGDILFAGSGETKEEIGKSVAYLDDSVAYAGGDIIVLRTNGVNNQYLAYALNHGKLAIDRAKLGQGHSVVHIYSKELANLSIKLPSKDEQQRIVSILSTWDKAIELKEKLIEQKKEQKTGLIETLLSGKKRIKGFNGEWKQVKLKEISHINKESLSNNTSSDYEFYYYDISSVENGNVAIQKDLIKFSDAPSRARRVFRKNDILMSTVRPNLKGFALIDFEVNDAVCSTGFAVITAEEVATNKFIYYNLFSTGIETQIEKLIVGSNYPAINASEVGNLKIYYPLDYNERQQIVDIIYCADKELKLLQLELKFLKEQKQALMQQLLTGKIRVKV
mgnify:CR=1 FL=1